jgi:hypothetical protein
MIAALPCDLSSSHRSYVRNLRFRIGIDFKAIHNTLPNIWFAYFIGHSTTLLTRNYQINSFSTSYLIPLGTNRLEGYCVRADDLPNGGQLSGRMTGSHDEQNHRAGLSELEANERRPSPVSPREAVPPKARRCPQGHPADQKLIVLSGNSNTCSKKVSPNFLKRSLQKKMALRFLFSLRAPSISFVIDFRVWTNN